MARYKLCFKDSFPGEPGGGGWDNDFYAEWGFEGTAREAIKIAERINYEKYFGDFRWWVVQDDNVKIRDIPFFEMEPKPKSNDFSFLDDLGYQLKQSKKITYHDSLEDLNSILKEPVWKSTITKRISPYNNQYSHTEFIFYKDDFLVRGSNYCGHGLKDGSQEALGSVEKVIYGSILPYGDDLDKILKKKYIFGGGISDEEKNSSIEFEVYDFHLDKGLKDKYMQKHKDFLDKEERELRNLTDKLKETGTTL